MLMHMRRRPLGKLTPIPFIRDQNGDIWLDFELLKWINPDERLTDRRKKLLLRAVKEGVITRQDMFDHSASNLDMVSFLYQWDKKTRGQ